MQTPLDITFRNMASSASIERAVRRWVERLERCHDRILGCSVLVERPHNHRTHGHHFHVRIDVNVAGRQIVVSRDPERDPGHEDVYVAIADAFRAARRQLLEHARTRRTGQRRVA
jgi:ribosome-associated translation inhibitor RaiA